MAPGIVTRKYQKKNNGDLFQNLRFRRVSYSGGIATKRFMRESLFSDKSININEFTALCTALFKNDKGNLKTRRSILGSDCTTDLR